MNKSLSPLYAVAACLLLTSVPVFAHHGDAGRYEDNLTILKGTVVDLQLITPHSIIVVDVTDESGKVVIMTDTGTEIFRTNNYGTEVRKRPAAGYDSPTQPPPAPREGGPNN
jgi:hypothetical protein